MPKPTAETPPEITPISEEEILEKTRAGMSRDQAITVITAQREHDAAN